MNKVLLKFEVPWCPICDTVDLMLRNFLPSDIEIQRVDVDDRPDIASEYHVDSVPTLILYENGYEIDRLSGDIPIKTLKRFLSV